MKDFNITSIHINRGYGVDAPFTAKVCVDNDYLSKMEIVLNEERTLAIIDLVSDLIVEGLNNHIADLKADAIARLETFQAKERAKLLEKQEGEEADFRNLDEAEL